MPLDINRQMWFHSIKSIYFYHMDEEEVKQKANQVQKARANFHRSLDEIKDKYFSKIKQLAEKQKQEKINQIKEEIQNG